MGTHFLGHGLEVHGIVMGLDAEAHASLEGPDPGGFANLDSLDAHASDGEVLIGRGDAEGGHLDGWATRKVRREGYVAGVILRDASWFAGEPSTEEVTRCSGIFMVGTTAWYMA